MKEEAKERALKEIALREVEQLRAQIVREDLRAHRAEAVLQEVKRTADAAARLAFLWIVWRRGE